MEYFDEYLACEASRIRDARAEFHSLLPSTDSVTGFGRSHAVAVFWVVDGHLKAVESLTEEGLVSSAAVVLRTLIFGAIRLAWLAKAKDDDDLLDARVVELKKSSLPYETGIPARLRSIGANEGDVKRLEARFVADKQEVQDWKSETASPKQSVDELSMAREVGDVDGLVTMVATLHHYVHLNRIAVDANVTPVGGSEDTYTKRPRKNPALVRLIVNSSLRAWGVAGVAFLDLIGASPELVSEVKGAAHHWLGDASDFAS